MSHLGTVADYAIRNLQAKALLDHYADSRTHRRHSEEQRLQARQVDHISANMQEELHHVARERQRLREELTKSEYSRQYQEMIAQRKRREQEDKSKELQSERENLHMASWIRDEMTQKQEVQLKKIQYGRELERHLRLQEMNKVAELERQRQMKRKLEREASEIDRKAKEQLQSRYIRKSMFDQKQNSILGIKESPISFQSLSTPKSMHTEEQRRFEKGLSVQLQAEQDSRLAASYEFRRDNNPEALLSNYNPITNPIPYKYKNPNVLKMLERYL